ncbi:hypothetical protein CIB84_001883 [Bambusicola thoracicus]|uniref:TATA element modulatory factor 1 TATA binding domain-containing protein n=1 Tax=Bambusicola thoracicus TaxID=9083 RepID=A0A2P4TDD7_BAMTH|nr:hypothetical protein CIB84_001883 [Bambusicola thoracicus]
MSWFNASQLSSFAKQALSQAQKSIDRVLDIQAEESPWPDAVIPDYGDGTNSLISGGWDTSSWGLSSNTEPQNQPVSPTAITKPVRRAVVDESENFFSAFLSPTDVQSIQKSPVVSKPPAKSQRPKEEVKSTLKEPQHFSQLEVLVTTEAEVKDSSVGGLVDLKNLDSPKEKLEESSVLKSNAEHEESTKEVADKKASALNLKEPEDALNGKSNVGADRTGGALDSNSQPPNTGTKDAGLETKEQKTEDRQSNTPSPPISTFSSGTSTTSDIEVLDHESVISESSVSSRQEAADSKSSLHLMQTSFQLLSTSACADYNRLDDFQKMTESGCSSDAFERIDSFSVQSLDSRSVSEINSDDELSGKACASASVAISPSAPKTETVDTLKSKSEDVNDSPVVHTEEAEMEESGRSATPVNSEQPDVLLSAVQTEEQVGKEETEPQPDADGKVLEEDSEMEKLKKMIDSLTEKLEKRETQLLSTSKEKARLEEAYDNLKDEMFRMKEETSSISSLKEEFAQRIADAEKKLQEVKTVKEELATRLNTNETAELLKEKEEQIKGLMEEGEKLSKQQLHNSNTIKKLRAKEKERENINTKQSKKIKELEEELQHLKQVLDGKEDLEKQHRDSIKQLNIVVERQEKDLAKLQAEVEDLEERNRSVQAALDSAYKELADLHKANATKDSEAQEAALSREMKAKEELGLALEKAKDEARQQQETLAIQVADLRLALQRAEQQAARKEDYLRQEISELQQIENLQATLGAQTSAWEKLEKNLSDRLGESQTLLAAAAERERAATEELMSNKVQMSSTESQNSRLRQENSRLQAQVEMERNKLKKMEVENSRYEVELEELKDEYAKTLEDAKKEKALLTTQLEMEKMKIEQERKKAIFAQEAAKEKDRKSFTIETVSSTPTMSRSSSISGVDMAGLQTSFLSQDDPHDHSFGPTATSGSNLYDAIRMGAGSSIIENLQSQLKLREGEISHLQLEIGNLEKTRSIMAEELVKLTNQNDELEEKVKEIPKLRAQLKMYGEKAEEAEELRLDLEDVKNMYKTQIDELLKQRQN